MIVIFHKDRPIATFTRAEYYPAGAMSAIADVHRTAAIDILTDHVHAVHRNFAIQGVSGPMPEPEMFAQSFVQKNSSAISRYVVKMQTTMYTLCKVEPQFTSKAPGQMVTANLDQLETVIRMNHNFAEELKMPHATNQAEILKDRIQRQLVFLWMSPNNIPVAVATLTGESKNSFRIGAVYTLPEERKKGFASSLTADICRHILTEKKKQYCILGADADNPVTNRMYQTIGFKYDHSAAVVDFVKTTSNTV